MPSPATPQPNSAAGSGVCGKSTAAVMTNDAARKTRPSQAIARRETRVAVRAWTQAPAVQVTVAAVSAKPGVGDGGPTHVDERQRDEGVDTEEGEVE